jgi:hypothetical protein
MYGRHAAGTSSTIATHQPAAATIARPARSRSRIRRTIPTGAATRYVSANAGTTRNACSILVRKPKPTSAPTATIQRTRPLSTARTVAYAPSTSSSTSSASGLLNRNISTPTGVSAMTTPASRPAPAPYQRRTVA